MKRPELRKLDRIIERVERLMKETDDMVAQRQLKDAANLLLTLYGTASRDCKATEGA